MTGTWVWVLLILLKQTRPLCLDITRDPYGPGGCGQVSVAWSSLGEFNVSEMGIKILEGEEEATCWGCGGV